MSDKKRVKSVPFAECLLKEPKKRKSHGISTSSKPNLPSFVMELCATPKEVQVLAQARLDKLKEDLFCQMAMKVKSAYTKPGQVMGVNLTYPHDSKIFDEAFAGAKEWMELLGWTVDKEPAIRGQIYIHD